MKPPQLNLRQNRCTLFEVTTSFQLDEDVHLDLQKKGLVAGEANVAGAVYLSKYKLNDHRHGCVFACVANTSTETKRMMQYECQLEYRQGTPQLIGKGLTVKQFSQLMEVFRNSATNCASTAQALFQFPLESFESRLQLPLTLQEDVDGKTVHMSGCELQIQIGPQKYSQYLGVTESHVISGITSLRIEEPFTSDSIKATFRECKKISLDMVKRIKGGSKR